MVETYPTPLKWLHDMWTDSVLFDVDSATKNDKKILDLVAYKGSEVGYD